MTDLDAPPRMSDRADPCHRDGQTEPNVGRLMLLSAAAGVLALILSASSRFLIVLMLRVLYPVQHHPAAPLVKGLPIRKVTMTAPASRLQQRAFEDPLSPLLLAPIIETLLFLAVYKLLERFGARCFHLVPFMAVLALLSWVLHGATRLDVGPALGFAVLAFVYFRTARAHGLAWAYLATVLAHMTWNSIPYAVYLMRN